MPGSVSTRPSASISVEAAGDILRAAVMVGHVERVEPGFRIGREIGGGAILVEKATALLHVGHLPEAGHEPADEEARREFGPLRDGRMRHEVCHLGRELINPPLGGCRETALMMPEPASAS